MILVSKFEDQTIQYRELTVSEYKTILKSLLGEEPDKDILCANLRCVFEEAFKGTNDFFQELYALFCLRQVSIGDKVPIIFCEDDKQINGAFTMEHCKKTLKREKLKVVKWKKYEVQLNWPSLIDLIGGGNYTEAFVKSIKINNTIVAGEIAKGLVGDLPFELYREVEKEIGRAIEVIENNPLGVIKSGAKEYQIPVPLYSDAIIRFLKIMFNGDLGGIYDQFFLITKNTAITPEYLDKGTPAELEIYTNRVLASQPQQELDEIDEDSAFGDSIV